jgi:phage terminase small subunit
LARAPDERIEQAKKLYLQGQKLVEIANRLNLPEGTVRRWKCTHKWDSERSDKKSERSEKKKAKKKKAAESEVDQVIENPELTDKQRLFCVYYIRSFNATKAYQKAYEVDYLTAAANGPRMLGNARVKKEILQLKQERLNREFLSESDIFQKYMDIAFADITDYLEFGTEEVPVMAIYGPVKTKDPETGEEKPLTKIVNTVRFKDSSEVDGTILAEVKQGRDGASIKLSDRMKALQWLSDNMKLGTEQQLARLEQQRAQIDLLRARKQDLTGENESQEAVEKLDQILKELRENAVKQQTE